VKPSLKTIAESPPVKRRRAAAPKFEALYIDGIDAVLRFYRYRFNELPLRALKSILTSWIDNWEPQRKSKYGRYNKKFPSERSQASPPWWPSDCPYTEPATMTREGEFQPYRSSVFTHHAIVIVFFAADLLLIHRQTDEQSGKRKKSWISWLRDEALETVQDASPGYFSQRKMSLGEVRKNRALTEILPSLFYIAEEHVRYITRYELFEGSGNENPYNAKPVMWEHFQRLDQEPQEMCVIHYYGETEKFACQRKPVLENFGSESKVDDTNNTDMPCSVQPAKAELVATPSTAFNPFWNGFLPKTDELEPAANLDTTSNQSWNGFQKIDMSCFPQGAAPQTASSLFWNNFPGNNMSCFPQVANYEPVAIPQAAFSPSWNSFPENDMSQIAIPNPHAAFDRYWNGSQKCDMPYMYADPSGHFQVMQILYEVRDCGLETFACTVDQPTTLTPTPFQFAPWQLSSNDVMKDPQDMNLLHSMQAELSHLQPALSNSSFTGQQYFVFDPQRPGHVHAAHAPGYP
jgi:hypothetical protein